MKVKTMYFVEEFKDFKHLIPHADGLPEVENYRKLINKLENNDLITYEQVGELVEFISICANYYAKLAILPIEPNDLMSEAAIQDIRKQWLGIARTLGEFRELINIDNQIEE